MSPDVIVITAVPLETPVINPTLFTVTTLVSDELNDTEAVSGTTETINCLVLPIGKLVIPIGVTSRLIVSSSITLEGNLLHYPQTDLKYHQWHYAQEHQYEALQVYHD